MGMTIDQELSGHEVFVIRNTQDNELISVASSISTVEMIIEYLQTRNGMDTVYRVDQISIDSSLAYFGKRVYPDQDEEIRQIMFRMAKEKGSNGK